MTKEIIRITKESEVFFKAHITKNQYKEILPRLSFFAKDYKHSPRYKLMQWSGRIDFIDSSGRFPIGLLAEFVKITDSLGYDVSFDFPKKGFGENISEETLQTFFEIVFPPETGIFPRDYQQESVLRAIRHGRGILNLATSSGKSLIIYSLLRYLVAKGKQCLVIVPNVSLVEQLYSDFQNDYGWKGAKDNICLNYSGKTLDINKKILLTTWQSVYKNSPEFFERYDALIVDEAHSMQGKSISEIGKKCVNASYRFGFSGSLPDNEADLHTVLGYLGPIIHKIMSHELIEKGVISNIKIKNLILKYPEHMRHARSTYQKEVDDINSYENRTKALDYIISNTSPEENILILVTKIEHLKATREYIQKNFKQRKVYEIYGKTDADVRENVRKRIEHESGVILVATYGTFSTGSNVKKLHHVVLFSSYKSQIKILQSIGRGLRKHESKEYVTIYDVVDQLIYSDGKKKYKNWTYLHWEQNRLKYYDEQQFDFENFYLNI